MKRLRVSGIVRDANRLRDALALPMTAQQCEQLHLRTQRSLQQISALLQQHNANLSNLSPQSRQAYQYLARFEPSQATIVKDAPAKHHRPNSVRFVGLQPFLDQTIDNIAIALSNDTLRAEKMCDVIQQTATHFEDYMKANRLEMNEIRPQSRQALAWFRYFSENDALSDYIESVRTLAATLEAHPIEKYGWKRPVIVGFKPISCMYRWRADDDATRVSLNTPFLAFDDDEMRRLAHRMLGDKQQERPVNRAMMAEPYQQILAEMESLAGETPETPGVHYCLEDSFNRVNQRYYNNAIDRPKLCWIRRMTARVFGRYNYIHDRLSISSTLDSPDVPEFVIDHIMHHELLHKKLGVKWRGHRRAVHTPAFRAEERTFERYTEADTFLQELSARLYGRR